MKTQNGNSFSEVPYKPFIFLPLNYTVLQLNRHYTLQIIFATNVNILNAPLSYFTFFCARYRKTYFLHASHFCEFQE